MEWVKTKELEIWLVGHKYDPRKPDIVLKEVDYKFINSGILTSGAEEKKIDFIPNHRILQVTITI